MTSSENCKKAIFDEGFFECQLPEGHEGQHSFTFYWSDEECVDI